MAYRLSKHSVHNVNYHLVFCPKRRKPVLVDDIEKDLHKIILEITEKMNVKIESLAIMPDHVHMFVSCPPTIAPHEIVKNIKGASSAYLRSRYPFLMKIPTMWSRSYYIGSIGHVSESVVKHYIENQKGK